jgi:4-phospho-D-threonate 3-dehydrogenase / 4-phospho-D-erythronate 3-dehydrogenase
MNSLPTIVLTMGDPAGVGPEIVLRALADPEVAALARWRVAGDSRILEMAGRGAGIALANASLDDIRELGDLSDFAFGRLDARCGRAAVEYVRFATGLCLAGAADAMVTAPVNKEAVSLSGRPFSGHTEYIAELCGAAEPRMLLATDRMAVVHVTTHIPLRQACEVDRDRVLRTIELGHEAMRLLGFERPRIAVCGLNPHAGEHGLFGGEDANAITPAIEAAKARGIAATGPHAPDTVFLQAFRGAFDLVVAMYHDQGHIPMKLLNFEEGVNITLGIPIIRTSVDHGTAFDIAGKGQADPRSMKQAMRMAAKMARTARQVGQA